MIKINKYNFINVQTLPHVQDSVENDKTQGQANHELREACGPGFAAPDPSTGPEIL